MKRQKEDSNNHSNTVDTLTDLSLLQLLQIHDSGFPIGTYTHSYGMETYIQKDFIQTKEELVTYCESYLFHNLVYGDAILIQAAYDAAMENNVEKLLELEQICGAMKLAKESRDASVNVGRQFIRTITPLMSNEFFHAWKKRIDQQEIKGHFAILYGIYSAKINTSRHHAVLTFLYATLSGLIQNAVRSVPFGQNTGVQAMHALIPSIIDATEQVSPLTVDDISNNALGIELASMKHEYLFSRLFIS